MRVICFPVENQSHDSREKGVLLSVHHTQLDMSNFEFHPSHFCTLPSFLFLREDSRTRTVKRADTKAKVDADVLLGAIGSNSEKKRFKFSTVGKLDHVCILKSPLV